MKATAIVLLLAAVIPASAKDHQYETGTVERIIVKAGWTDTTACYGQIGALHCSGDVYDDYAVVYVLHMPDGSQHHIRHTAMFRDPVKDLDFSPERYLDCPLGGPCIWLTRNQAPVQYRIERKRGLLPLDYIFIPGPDGKEGRYNFDTLKMGKGE